jgi:hypothetical protein
MPKILCTTWCCNNDISGIKNIKVCALCEGEKREKKKRKKREDEYKCLFRGRKRVGEEKKGKKIRKKGYPNCLSMGLNDQYLVFGIFFLSSIIFPSYLIEKKLSFYMLI